MLTLLFCLTFYIASSVLTYAYLGIVSILLGVLYTAMILFTFYYARHNGIFRIYQYFPLLNAASGFVLFWFVALTKFF